MKQVLTAVIAGFIFGIGLALSKMIDPNKVLNFLDVTGNWDPSLALVMAGALSIAFIAFRFIPQRDAPVFDNKFRLSTQTAIDKSLILGSIIFGMGWGMAGFCPGPAIASLAFGGSDLIIFVIAMLTGFALQTHISKKLNS